MPGLFLDVDYMMVTADGRPDAFHGRACDSGGSPRHARQARRAPRDAFSRLALDISPIFNAIREL